MIETATTDRNYQKGRTRTQQCTDRHSRSIYQLGKRNRRTNRQSRQSISQMGENKPRTNRNCDNRKNHNCIVTVRRNRKRNQHVTVARTRRLEGMKTRRIRKSQSTQVRYMGGRRGSGSILPDANLWPKKPSSAASIRPFNTIRL